MRANEAFEIANKVKKEREELRLKKIYDDKQFQSIIINIKKACDEGLFSTTFYNVNNKDYVKALTGLGYKCEFYGDELRINWLMS